MCGTFRGQGYGWSNFSNFPECKDRRFSGIMALHSIMADSLRRVLSGWSGASLESWNDMAVFVVPARRFELEADESSAGIMV
jgi:hypothetical protein